jgi:hypothetical protein
MGHARQGQTGYDSTQHPHRHNFIPYLFHDSCFSFQAFSSAWPNTQKKIGHLFCHIGFYLSIGLHEKKDFEIRTQFD